MKFSSILLTTLFLLSQNAKATANTVDCKFANNPDLQLKIVTSKPIEFMFFSQKLNSEISLSSPFGTSVVEQAVETRHSPTRVGYMNIVSADLTDGSSVHIINDVHYTNVFAGIKDSTVYGIYTSASNQTYDLKCNFVEIGLSTGKY